mmetsp:Transcript_39259/g.83633  ORF Transcript_39259/g.83633 Transcript_39259/m.83633 type:complete len:104 (-) Transcript_39259:56-367(-)
MPGEGLVGKAFANQQIVFSEDLQALAQTELMDAITLGDHTGFFRTDLAKEYGIHSAIFMPTANGVLEVGSTQQVARAFDLLSNAATVLPQIISPATLHSAGLG